MYIYIYIYIKVKWSRYRPGVAQRVGRGIALLFHDRGTRMGWVISSTPRPHFTLGIDPVPILQEAGWAPGPVWKGGKSRPRRDSIPDRPARSSVGIPTELPGPLYVCVCVYIYTYIYACNFVSLLFTSFAYQYLLSHNQQILRHAVCTSAGSCQKEAPFRKIFSYTNLATTAVPSHATLWRWRSSEFHTEHQSLPHREHSSWPLPFIK